MRAKPTPEQAPYFLPARLGGIGAGFTRGRDKEQSPAYLGAIKPGNSLSDTPDTSHARMSPDAPARAKKAIDASTVRARAQVVAMGLLRKLHDSRDSMDVSEIVDSLNAVGKLTGAITPANGGGVTVNLGSLHLDALRAARPLSNSIGDGQIEDAHILPNPANDNGLDGGNAPGDASAAGQG